VPPLGAEPCLRGAAPRSRNSLTPLGGGRIAGLDLPLGMVVSLAFGAELCFGLALSGVSAWRCAVFSLGAELCFR
jgi:hypothetical protein